MGIISGFMVQAKSLGPYVYYEYLKDHTDIGVRGLVNLFFFGILQFTSLTLAFLYFSEYKPDIPEGKSDTLESELRDLSFENN